MNDSPLKTLFHPFEAGLIEPLHEGARALFLNAAPGFRLPEGLRAHVSAVQDFRPSFLALQAAGHQVTPQPQDEGYDLSLVLAGRHRGQNELWVADALRLVRPGGLVLVAGGKTDGAASLKKRIGALVPLAGHAAKSHGVAFWFERGETALETAAALAAANPPLVLESGFHTVPGLFSHDRVDAGSQFLADSLPADLAGRVADFGAGWGFLSVALAQRAGGVTAIDLYEAGFSACEAARANMAELAPHVAAQVLWHDLLTEETGRFYDAVVMNPPFHHGRAAEPAIGEAMIRKAAAALRPGGRLYLVANRPLPYEPVLQGAFSRHGETCRDARYKVLWAIR